MAEERNTHVKLAMADVMGLLVVSMFTMAVAAFGLGGKTDFAMLNLVGAIGPFVGFACLIVAVIAFINENILATAIFGPLAIFFLAITAVPAIGAESSAMLCIVIGIIILIDAIVAFAQPVKLLPILLIIAAIAFFLTAFMYDTMNQGKDFADSRQIVGIMWLIYSVNWAYSVTRLLSMKMH
jgi:hypothetical protein